MDQDHSACSECMDWFDQVIPKTLLGCVVIDDNSLREAWIRSMNGLCQDVLALRERHGIPKNSEQPTCTECAPKSVARLGRWQIVDMNRDQAATYGVALVAFLAVAGLWFDLRFAAMACVGLIAFAAIMVVKTRRDLLARVDGSHQHLVSILDSYHSPLRAVAPRHPFPPMRMPGAWAATPDFAAVVVGQIESNKPKRILEMGSGASTIISAYTLERLGDGHVYSLDHDTKYAQETTKSIEKHGLTKYATVIPAPLTTHQVNGEAATWYDTSNLPDEPIDMVVVDGPPATGAPYARHPALPILHSHLSPNAVVILDDSIRESERWTVDSWLKQFPEFTSEYVNTEKGTYVLKR